MKLERRGKKVLVRQTITQKPPAESDAPPLALGKLNAIRAAFKAGVKPSAIAKQFRRIASRCVPGVEEQ